MSRVASSAAAIAVTSNRHYLSAGGQVIGVLVTTGALPTLAAGDTAPPVLANTTAVKLEYWHKDHLGSTAATTDHTGALTARYAYDPFGKRRASNGSYDAAGAIVVDWSHLPRNYWIEESGQVTRFSGFGAQGADSYRRKDVDLVGRPIDRWA